MTNHPVSTKYELIVETAQAYAALEKTLEQLTREQLTLLQDPQGWTIKDHLAHLAAWQQSVISMLQGRPRHEGLEVDEALYREGSFDEINAVIQKHHQDLTWEQALGWFRETHQRFLSLLEPLNDADLLQPYAHYLPDEADRAGDRLAIEALYDNSGGHFGEHLGYIKALVDTSE